MRTSESDLNKGSIFTKTLGKRQRSMWMYSKRDKHIYICGYIIGVYDIRAERLSDDGIEYRV
jgi:hypothetical protein